MTDDLNDLHQLNYLHELCSSPPQPTKFVVGFWNGDGREYALRHNFYYNSRDPNYSPSPLLSRESTADIAYLFAQKRIGDGYAQYAEIWHEAYGHRWLYDRLSDYWDRFAKAWLTLSQRRHGEYHFYVPQRDVVVRCVPDNPYVIDALQDFTVTPLPPSQNRKHQTEIEQIRAQPRDDLDTLIAQTKGDTDDPQ